ncbi:MAG: hypothetical protein NTV01_20145 [Bacteroidia bacterium]|nr:hypothetical protein [Bacteroidia bacterium]
MSLSLKDNRSQPVFGAFIIFLYALYGAFIVFLFILQGNKGALPSEDFLLFVIVFLLLGISNFGKLLILRTVNVGARAMLLLFLIYLFFKILFLDSERFSYYLKSIIDMGSAFIAGFIAFSTINSSEPVISKIIKKFQSGKGIRSLVVISTMIFIGLMLYFLNQLLGTSPSGAFKIMTIQNDYYQNFGDLVTILFCCLLSLQIYKYDRDIYSERKFVLLSIVIIAESAIAFICLQVANSNKSVLVIALISIISIYHCKPKNWLISHSGIKLKAFFLIPIVLIFLFLSFQLVTSLDITTLRAFDYGEGNSVLTNSSIQSRRDIIDNYFIEQFQNALIFGDMSIKYYMHSSLLSIQTHLGVIGSFLFWSFITLQLRQVYRRRGNSGLKAIAPSVIFVSIISSFFTWGPLWFLVGALYAYQPQSLDQFHMRGNENINVA